MSNSNYTKEQIEAWQNSSEYKAMGEKFLANINSGNSNANHNIQAESDAAMGRMFPTQNTHVSNLNKYLGAAEEEFNPAYNAKVTALKNALSQNTLALDQQKYGVNSNFNTQVDNQNRQNVHAQNNFSNQSLNRGLGRSSVAVTGLAEMDMTNNRQVGEINQNRSNALSNIEAQKAQELNNHNNVLLQMEGDKQSSINNLARQMEERQDSINFRNKQWDYQVGRDVVGDNRYSEDKKIDSQRYVDSINYRDSRDKVGDSRYDQEIKTDTNRYVDSINYRNSRDKIGDTRYDNDIIYRNKQDDIEMQRYNNDYAAKLKAIHAKESASAKTAAQKKTSTGLKDTTSLNSAVNKSIAEVDTITNNASYNFDERIKTLNNMLNSFSGLAGNEAKYMVAHIKKSISIVNQQKSDFISIGRYKGM